MTIDDLKSFMLVCRLHSFSTAAVELSMTQSALSKRLQAIQQEVGSELISTENRRQILITESGKVFYRYAQRIVSSYDELEQELKAYRELKKGNLQIGSVPVMSQYGLTKIINIFERSYPQIDIHLNELEGNDLLMVLKAGEIDAGIIRDIQTKTIDNNHFNSYTLDRDELKVVLPANDSLNNKKRISIEELANYQVISLESGSGIYEKMVEIYNNAGIPLNVGFKTTHIETIMGMIKNSDQITFLFKKSAMPFMNKQLVMLSLDQPIYSNLELICPRENQHKPALTKFIEYMKKYTSEPVESYL